MQKYLNQLERKLYRFNIPPFVRYLVFAMGGVYLLDLFVSMSTAYADTQISVISYLTLNVGLVLQGQVWRLVTWLIVPMNSSPIWILLSLYFYYFIGTALESRWGVRRLLIYFVIGALANIAGAFIAYFILSPVYGNGILTGYMAMIQNWYLYCSLFFAFAALYPDVQFTLFFVLPVQAKWLGLIDLVYFAVGIITGSVGMRCAAIASLVNVALFFGPDIYNTVKREINLWNRRRAFRK